MSPSYLQSALRALLVTSSIAPSIVSGSAVVKRDGIIPATLPGSWTSLGCYTDIGRTLTGGFYENAANMTIETCIDYCSTNGFLYAGTEYSSQCFCGNKLAAAAKPAMCHMTCAGNHTEACGDASKLNVFFSGQSGPQTNPGPGLWSLLGCFTEGQTGRTLPNGVAPQGGAAVLTIGTCTDACQAAGYTLAGAEYGQECWCGNAISNGGTVAPEGISGCNVLCKGNASEYCGGPSRLDVYNFNGSFTTPTGTPTTTVSPTALPTAGDYTYYGCQTEGNGLRALGGKGTSSAVMTIEACHDFCFGYTYFGTEYGSECYCGNGFGAGSVKANETDCNYLCPGNVAEFCGAGNRLSVYQRNNTVSPTTTPTSVPITLPTGWGAQGCWAEPSAGRLLTGHQFDDNPALTIESCVNACAAASYTVAGMEYSQQCFCDNAIQNSGARAQFETECDMKCAGNNAQTCGGGNRVSVYSLGALTVLPAPA